MNIDQLRDTLKIDEGVKYEIYNDHLGYPTFGIGHLVVESDEEHGKPVGTPVSEDRVNSVFETVKCRFSQERTTGSHLRDFSIIPSCGVAISARSNLPRS